MGASGGRFQAHDYYITKLSVKRAPKAQVTVDDVTGEETLCLIPVDKPAICERV